MAPLPEQKRYYWHSKISYKANQIEKRDKEDHVTHDAVQAYQDARHEGLLPVATMNCAGNFIWPAGKNSFTACSISIAI